MSQGISLLKPSRLQESDLNNRGCGTPHLCTATICWHDKGMKDRQNQISSTLKCQKVRRARVGHNQVELLPKRGYCAAYTCETAIVGFAYETQVGVHAFATGRRTPFRGKPNALAYVPRGCDVYSHSPAGGEYLKITFAQSANPSLPSNQRFSDAVDGAAIQAAQRMRAVLLSSEQPDPLELELLIAILTNAAINVLNNKHTCSPTEHRMTPARLRCVDELIECHLADQLTVQFLAENLGLSTGYFARAFKASTGKSPHDYIIDKRISHARALLQASKLQDISAIALASGFTSHSHLTNTFRTRLGATPSELRAGFG